MNKKILIVLDGARPGEQVVPWARRLAGHGRALIHLLVVRPEVKTVQIRGRHALYVDQLESQARAEALSYLRTVARKLEDDGFEVTAVVRFGEPVRVILDVARETGADVVAIATYRPTGIRALWTRSIADELLRRSPVPVLVTRPDQAAA
jgi:nucleotide-binding universal stress UspA family protein